MANQDIYIEPALWEYEVDINVFLSQTTSSLQRQDISFDNLHEKARLFILGGPGVGKSTLMRRLHDSTKSSIIVDCKLTDELMAHELIDYIKQLLKNDLEDRLNENNEMLDTAYNQLRVIFFDALDEVSEFRIIRVLKLLVAFSEKNRNKRIYISCRTHHLRRLRNVADLSTFEFVEIGLFSRENIYDYLKSNSEAFENVTYDSLISKLKSSKLLFDWWVNRTSILETPRYLKYFVEILASRSLSSISGLSRCDLFKEVVRKRLTKERNDNVKLPHPLYVERCLELLALVLEIQRTDKLSKGDFFSLLFELQIGLDRQLDLNDFYKETILKDTDDLLEFENTEFQEYLAARAILRLGSFEQVVFDLAIDKRQLIVLPSWNNTLTYLVEHKPETVYSFVELARRTKNTGLLTLLSYLPPKDLTNFSDLFPRVLEVQNESNDWLSGETAVAMAGIVTTNQFQLLLTILQGADSSYSHYIRKFNALAIISLVDKNSTLGTFIQSDKLKKDILWPIVKKEDSYLEYSPLRRDALKLLGKYADAKEINEICDLYEGANKSIQTVVIEILKQEQPNHKKSMLFFFKHISKRNTSDENPFYTISSRRGILNFYRVLLEDDYVGTSVSKHKWIERNVSSYKTEGFFKTLSSRKGADIKSMMIRSLLCMAIQPYHKGWFYEGILNCLINGYKVDYLDILDCVEKYFKEADPHSISLALGMFINESNVESFVKYWKEKYPLSSLPYYVLTFSDNLKVKGFRTKYYPEQVLKENVEQEKWSHLHTGDRNVSGDNKEDKLEKYLDCLSKGHYECILHQLKYNEEVYEKLNYNSKKKTIELVASSFEKIDSEEIFIKIDGSTTSISNAHVWFETAVLWSKRLEINLQKFREKIILFIPYAMDSRRIIEMVSPLSDDEVSEVVNFIVESRATDIYKHGMWNVLDLLKASAKTEPAFVMGVLTDNDEEPRNKALAVELLEKYGEYDYLIELFKTRILKKEYDEDLYLISVACLRHGNLDALEWRIDQIKNSPYIERDTNGRFVPVPQGRGMGAPISEHPHLIFKERLLEFLDESFKILSKDVELLSYVSNEIWDVVVNYFIKLTLSIEQLSISIGEIRRIYESNRSVSYAVEFKKSLKRLVDYYREMVGEPLDFNSALKMLRTVKTKHYLPLLSTFDLFSLIIGTINVDHKTWVYQGYYAVIGSLYKHKGGYTQKEDLIQKDLSIQLENQLLKKGLRGFDIYREVQKLDNDRIDLVVSYGGIGSVLIEVKLSHNKNLNGKKAIRDFYHEKMYPYMQSMGCEYGILLIFKIREEQKEDKYLKIMEENRDFYSQFPKIEVIGIDCLDGLR